MIQRHLFALLLLVAFVPAAPAADAVRPSAPAHPPGVAIASAHTLALVIDAKRNAARAADYNNTKRLQCAARQGDNSIVHRQNCGIR